MLIRSLWKQSNHHLSLGSSFIIQEGHSVLIWRAGNLMLLHVNSLTWNYCPWCDFTNKLVHFYLFARDFRDRGELYTSLVISPALFQVNTQFSSSLHHHVLFLPVALALALFHSGMNRQSYFFSVLRPDLLPWVEENSKRIEVPWLCILLLWQWLGEVSN